MDDSTNLGAQLAQAREDLRRRGTLESELSQVRKQLGVARRRLEARSQVLEKEAKDVAALERTSFTSLLATLLGDRKEKLSKEQGELLTAKLRHDEQREQVDALEAEEADLADLVTGLADAETRLTDLARQKESELIASHAPAAEQLSSVGQRLAEHSGQLHEVDEALEVAIAARHALDEVGTALQSARSWAVIDIVDVAPIISDVRKYAALKRARAAASRARRHLRQLQHELGDVRRIPRLDIGGDSVLTMADWLFDNLVVDWLVLSRIDRSIDRLRGARHHVRSISEELRGHQRALRADVQALEQERLGLLGLPPQGQPSSG